MKDNRRLGLWLCFLVMALSSYAQYAVTGGNGTPMLAETDKDVQIWLVNGMQNVEISYTSATAGTHKWYRYRTKANEAEPFNNSIQNGSTSVIQNLEEGWGYFVEETAVTKRFIWIIDYSQYAFEINRLEVEGGTDPCYSFRLKSDIEIQPLVYYSSLGVRSALKRTFDLSYETLEWSEDNKAFIRKTMEKKIEGQPFGVSLDPAPLVDTDFVLKGDQFARHFNMEKTIRSDYYQTVSLEVKADTSLIADPFSNGGGSGLSAPATISFKAYANEPVAAIYIWYIYSRNDENGRDNAIKRNEPEFEFTFSEAGGYRVDLEVSDRAGTCTNADITFNVDISDSFLEIPNAFSPGTTPGINDEFRVAYKSLVKFKGWIFNRWGNQIFHWTDPSQGWDGKKGGKYVSPGVYFYVIEAEGSDGKKYKETGDINILRSKNIDDAPIN